MEYKYKFYFKPRHSDIDGYAIAHHSKFFCWFEEARYALFENIPSIHKEILNTYKLPVTSLFGKYVRTVSQLDEMVVQVRLSIREESPLLHFDYRLLDQKEHVLFAKGYTEHVFLDDQGKIVRNVPEDIQNLIHALIEA